MNRILGTLTGSGGLLADDLRVGTTTYEIIVRQEGGQKTAFGLIEGEWETLGRAFQGQKTMLELQTGELVQIIITQLFGDSAQIQISGPVPGF